MMVIYRGKWYDVIKYVTFSLMHADQIWWTSRPSLGDKSNYYLSLTQAHLLFVFVQFDIKDQETDL